MTDTAISRGYTPSRLGSIHVARTGSGAPLVLLPQSGRSWSMYESLMPLMADAFSVIAIDYPGSGSSDPLPDGASIEDMAGAVVDVLDGLDVESANVYGLHIGNKIGSVLGARHASRLRKLVLAGQNHSLVADSQRRAGTVGKTRRKLLDASGPHEAALVQWSDTFARLSSLWWSEHVVRDLADERTRRRTICRAFDELQSMQGMSGYYRANYGFDFGAEVSRIGVPTLVLEIVTPTEDALIGRHGQALAATIANARYTAIERPDEHGITLDDCPESLAAILRDFLPDVPADD